MTMPKTRKLDRLFPGDPGYVPDHEYGMFADISKQAHEMSRSTAQAMREKILSFNSFLKRGATSDELAELMGVSIEAIARRMPELEKAGKVYKTGLTRMTRKGCPATVWKINENLGGLDTNL